MFDTIRLYVDDIQIALSRFTQIEKDIGADIETFFDVRTGNQEFIAEIKNHVIYFKYRSLSQSLFMELSIPKFLFVNNIKNLELTDIPNFYTKLELELYELFGVFIPIEHMKVSRLDVSYNFNISQTKISTTEWIHFISNQKMNHKKVTQVYKNTDNNLHESVAFTTKKNSHQNRITFYDKHVETNYNPKAKNILRVEIKTSKEQRKKFGKKMTELLNQQFFDYMMLNRYKILDQLNEWLMQIQFEKETADQKVLLFFLEQEELNQKEIINLLAFMYIHNNPMLKGVIKPMCSSNTWKSKESEYKKIIRKYQRYRKGKNDNFEFKFA